MGSPVVHWELMSKDPAKLSDFYAKIFGWKIQHRPEMNYRIVDTGGEGGINGGILKPEREGPSPSRDRSAATIRSGDRAASDRTRRPSIERATAP